MPVCQCIKINVLYFKYHVLHDSVQVTGTFSSFNLRSGQRENIEWKSTATAVYVYPEMILANFCSPMKTKVLFQPHFYCNKVVVINCNLSTPILMNIQQKDKVFEKSNCNALTIIMPSSCTVLFINWSQSTLERRSVSLPPFYSLASFSYSALSSFAKCIQNSLYPSFRSNVKWEWDSFWHERVLFAFHILQPLRTQTLLFFSDRVVLQSRDQKEIYQYLSPFRPLKPDFWQLCSSLKAERGIKNRERKEGNRKVPWLHSHCQIMEKEIIVWAPSDALKVGCQRL